MTPATGPQSTYYSTLNWPGAYGGIQFDDYGGPISKVLFSVWDIDASKKAEILDQGACNETVGFGGEGTGTSCRLLLPPSEHGAIAGLPDDYMLQPGDTYETHLVVSHPADCATCSDYTFTFTDVTRGLGPISLGTQRYKENVEPWYGSGFIEDWSDQPGDHCLNAGTRTAYFHDLQAKTAAGWQAITSASFNAVYLQRVGFNQFGMTRIQAYETAVAVWGEGPIGLLVRSSVGMTVLVAVVALIRMRKILRARGAVD